MPVKQPYRCGHIICTVQFKTYKMKKLILSMLVIGAIGFSASAQDVKANNKKAKVETSTTETKVKKTSTPTQKVGNVIHPKRKHYSGVKVKHEGKKD